MALSEIINCGLRGFAIPAFLCPPIPDGWDNENLLGNDVISTDGKRGLSYQQILRFLFNTKTIQVDTGTSACSLRDAVGGGWAFSQTLDCANGIGVSPVEGYPDSGDGGTLTARRLACGYLYVDGFNADAPDTSVTIGSPDPSNTSPGSFGSVPFGSQNLNQFPTNSISPTSKESKTSYGEGPLIYAWNLANNFGFTPFQMVYTRYFLFYDQVDAEPPSKESRFFLLPGGVRCAWGANAAYAGDGPPAEASGPQWFGGGVGVAASCQLQLTTPDLTSCPIVGYYSFTFADGVSSSVPIYQDPFTPETRYADAYLTYTLGADGGPGDTTSAPYAPGAGPALTLPSAIVEMSANLSAGVIEEWIGGIV